MPRATTFKCSVCGQEHPIADMTRTQDRKKVCPSCRDANYKQCPDCGEWVKKDARHMAFVYDHDTDTEKLVCKRCLNEKYFLCMICGRYHANAVRHDGIRIGHMDGSVCAYCYGDRFATCPECGTESLRSETIEHDGHTYCRRCFDERFFRCRDCCTVFPQSENDGHGRCHQCHDREEERLRRERNRPHCYHWGRDEHWYGEPLRCEGEDADALSFGVELEMDCGQFDFDRMGDGDVLYHFERDGSLGDRGAECITQPCTLLYHQNKFPWRTLLANSVSCGFKSHNTSTCGLHVHIGKGSVLDSETEAKLDLFVNRNIEQWEKIARRSSGRWAAAYKGKSLAESKRDCSLRGHSNRYQAVNHTNEKTVEIRIAKGTLKYETLLGTIELYAACVLFVKDLTVDESTVVDGETWDAFVKYVCDRKDQYPNGVWLLATHGGDGMAKLLLCEDDAHGGGQDPIAEHMAASATNQGADGQSAPPEGQTIEALQLPPVLPRSDEAIASLVADEPVYVDVMDRMNLIGRAIREVNGRAQAIEDGLDGVEIQQLPTTTTIEVSDRTVDCPF